MRRIEEWVRGGVPGTREVIIATSDHSNKIQVVLCEDDIARLISVEDTLQQALDDVFGRQKCIAELEAKRDAR